jgi:hypothetical protein
MASARAMAKLTGVFSGFAVLPVNCQNISLIRFLLDPFSFTIHQASYQRFCAARDTDIIVR